MQFLGIINFGFVLFFGITLSLSFADLSIRRHTKDYFLILLSFGTIQLIVYLMFDIETLFKGYPVFIHIPLLFLIKYCYKKSFYISGIAVFCAYLFCTPRKWIGTFISLFFHYDADVSYLVQIAITIPFLILIMKYVSPSIARLKYEDYKILRIVIFFPFFYYFIEYAITVYTDLLYTGGPATVEFIDSSIVTVYFIFSIMFLKTLYEKKEIEVERAVLNIMTSQFDNEIEALKKSEQQSRIYRHDLRHHLNYLNACIADNRLTEAADYIRQTCTDIDNAKVTQYSNNESVNLILSSYAGRAKEKNIAMTIHVSTDNFQRFQITDLCSLLANALENAVNACVQIEEQDKRCIRLRMYEKNNKLCLSLSNSYGCTPPRFLQGIPISCQSGHGIGIKSIMHVAEKYDGIYQFAAKNGIFTFQLSM